MTVNPFACWISDYYDDPVRFVREVFSVAEIDPWQQALMASVARGDRRLSVRSGHGVGKTTVLAWICVWWILTRTPQKTVCTAPTSAQLFDALANEVFAWIGKLPADVQDLLVCTSDRVELKAAPKESFISFRTSRPDTPEAMAGIHSKFVLLICDEASGIPDAVFEAGAGSMSGLEATTILAGNPVRTSGLFFDSHHKLRDIWQTFVVNCEDCARVGKDYIEDMARRYGRESNSFRVRVLGEFPKADDDTVISFELMEAALSRDVKAIDVQPIWGLDCAGAGKDRSALAKRKGNVLLEPCAYKHGLETMQIVGWVKTIWDATSQRDRPSEICVDSIGLGSGVASRLAELGLPARGVNVSESPSMGGLYINLRGELWWTAREWFEARDCNLCNDEKLGAELIGVKWEPARSSGKTQIEDKRAIKKRMGHSPDLADAFVLTFAAAAISAGSNWNMTSWRTAIKRNIKGIV